VGFQSPHIVFEGGLTLVVEIGLVADVFGVTAKLGLEAQRCAVHLGMQASQRDAQGRHFGPAVGHRSSSALFLQSGQQLASLDGLALLDVQLGEHTAIR